MDRDGNALVGAACCGCVDSERRRSLGLLLAGGAAATLIGRQAWADDGGVQAPAAGDAKSPPRAGDEIVFAKGERKGGTVTVADLATVGTILECWAKDPASGTVRSGSRLNRILVMHLDPAGLDEATTKRAAEGMVAYSGFCTHAGCFIENLRPEDDVI